MANKNSFRYKYELALKKGWTLPKAINATQRKIRDEILDTHEQVEIAKENNFTRIMYKPPIELRVNWTEANLKEVRGTISVANKNYGQVRLTRQYGTSFITFLGEEDLKELPIILTSTGTILDHPWVMNIHLTSYSICQYVLGSEWDKMDPVIPVIQIEVPVTISDQIFDIFGIEPEHIVNSWLRMTSDQQIESRKLWSEQWAIRNAENKKPEEPERSNMHIFIDRWERKGKTQQGILLSPSPSWLGRVVLKMHSDGTSQIRLFSRLYFNHLYFTKKPFSILVETDKELEDLIFSPKKFPSWRGYYCNLNKYLTEAVLNT